MRHPTAPSYLTPRGYVAACDLTVADVLRLRDAFELRDASALDDAAFAALCCLLGLEVLRTEAGHLFGRLRRAA